MRKRNTIGEVSEVERSSITRNKPRDFNEGVRK